MKYRIEKIICLVLDISRSECKKVLKSERIKINGIIISKPRVIDINKDNIEIDGELIQYKEFQYFMFNKPSGLITANYDLKQKTIFSILNLNSNKFFAIGRLDKDTEGLLLITNDGEMAHKISNPKYKIPKKYYFELNKEMTTNIKDHIPKPIILLNGYQVKEYNFEFLDLKSGYLTIYEGKFHQVKEMLNFFNYEITFLKRISIGKLELDSKLEIGKMKELELKDLELIFK
ncbi:rRNA pseudouridine synthase [Metamycoplasma phocicerebrale]|uniref:rRNA pseudouridine synthase n=1 Tax=Metamycoplasma phocicerebrale TaxID=142649 RepID=A0A3Q9V522_9BACT|nr:pseudouridine synthase [Metamycoplasma phocicerebrale]AZZ65238.2 rRNA pseudouridine synthase [Metamycoplasma phocicerebrale]